MQMSWKRWNMVISNLNTSRILDLLRFMENCLNEIRQFSAMGREEFLSDRKNPPFVESYLRRSLEAVFDIGRHILAKLYGFREIEYKTIARALGEKGIISQNLSDTIQIMAGYRNRMVHFYREVSPEELHSIVVNNLKDFDRFSMEIVSFIKAYEQDRQNNLPE